MIAVVTIPMPPSCPLLEPEKMEAVNAGILSRMKMLVMMSSKSSGKFWTIVTGSFAFTKFV